MAGVITNAAMLASEMTSFAHVTSDIDCKRICVHAPVTAVVADYFTLSFIFIIIDFFIIINSSSSSSSSNMVAYNNLKQTQGAYRAT